MRDTAFEFGATPLSDRSSRFVAWAPGKSGVSVVIFSSASGTERVIPLEPRCGFHIAEVDASEGTRYMFRMPEGQDFPDPASRFQPEGVHRPSAIVDTRKFPWADEEFRGHSLRDLIIYELHVGTFTPQGTFEAAMGRLDDLVELGVTAVEIMPVSQFPGSRNWGYDGVYPYAVQNSYGGPSGLQRFVDVAHGKGLSVILDVVYNHLGPEGNYFSNFGPFFTKKYSTPWGEAINYDGAESDAVRSFFIQNALYWLRDFHIDGLRLDAVHGIYDFSAHHFLAALKEEVLELANGTSRKLHVIAESDLNDSRLLHDTRHGGYALDAQWSDDFHHALHVLLTGEKGGYYADFGSIADLATTMRDGWLYAGQFSRFRKRRYGNSPKGIATDRFVVYSQNHDQVGNRAGGERLADLVDFHALKMAAAVTLLSPFVPLLFMGEEYGEKRPFLYFTSHGDHDLIEAVRKGRSDEFAAFGWTEIPDPQSEATFERSKLNYREKDAPQHRLLWNLYRALIGLRKNFRLGGCRPEVEWNEQWQTIRLVYLETGLTVIYHFGNDAISLSALHDVQEGDVILNSNDAQWCEPVAAVTAEQSPEEIVLRRNSFVVFASTVSSKP
jgi:maltooligosyltrehalose trehalohydrolase